MAGVVFTPEDPDYDQARLLWNADADRHPAVVARCSGAPDVVAAVRYAQAEGLEIAVRCGAHSASGQSGVEGGLVVDLSGMRQVTVDPERKRARAGGGALISDLDAATQAHGLAVPTGLVGHTGIGGLTLGGGMGWLTRQAGMACDNVESVEIVVADGRILRASAAENPELYWAVRGGGGNFGVVTEFEYRLHEVGPMIQFGFLFWEAERGREALRAIREAVATMPRSCNILLAGLNAPPAPFVPAEHHLKAGFALVLCGFGDPDEHAQTVDRLRAALPPLVEAVTPMPYTALNQAFDQANCWGQYYYETSTRYGAARPSGLSARLYRPCRGRATSFSQG
jgi:FAD/FMN-containing dehydrogenase